MELLIDRVLYLNMSICTTSRNW